MNRHHADGVGKHRLDDLDRFSDQAISIRLPVMGP